MNFYTTFCLNVMVLFTFLVRMVSVLKKCWQMGSRKGNKLILTFEQQQEEKKKKRKNSWRAYCFSGIITFLKALCSPWAVAASSHFLMYKHSQAWNWFGLTFQLFHLSPAWQGSMVTIILSHKRKSNEINCGFSLCSLFLFFCNHVEQTLYKVWWS